MSNNKQQTAVEYFAKEIFYTIELLKKGYVNDQDLFNTVIVIRDKAKEMEKEQIMDAHIESGARLEDISIESAEQYYNQTYGDNK